MDCKDIQDLLSAYIDNRCSEEEKLIVERHLETCPECLEEYTLLKTMIDSFSDVQDIELPDHFHDELMGKINATKKGKRRVPRKWALPVAAAFLVVFIFSVIGINQIIDWSTNSNDESVAEMNKEAGFDRGLKTENEEVAYDMVIEEYTMDTEESMDSQDIETLEETAPERVLEDEAYGIKNEVVENKNIAGITSEGMDQFDLSTIDSDTVKEESLEQDDLTIENSITKEFVTEENTEENTEEDICEVTNESNWLIYIVVSVGLMLIIVLSICFVRRKNK